MEVSNSKHEGMAEDSLLWSLSGYLLLFMILPLTPLVALKRILCPFRLSISPDRTPALPVP